MKVNVITMTERHILIYSGPEPVWKIKIEMLVKSGEELSVTFVYHSAYLISTAEENYPYH